MGIFDKGVKKTNRGFFDRLSRAIIGKAQVDEDLLDAIEEAAAKKMADAVDFALNSPEPDPEHVLDDVFFEE